MYAPSCTSGLIQKDLLLEEHLVLQIPECAFRSVELPGSAEGNEPVHFQQDGRFVDHGLSIVCYFDNETTWLAHDNLRLKTIYKCGGNARHRCSGIHKRVNSEVGRVGNVFGLAIYTVDLVQLSKVLGLSCIAPH